MVSDCQASSVNVLPVLQDSAAFMSMLLACTPEPVVVTETLPDASSVSRSPALSTASFAVGAQTPPEQLMFCVVCDEIATAAWALVVANMDASAATLAPPRSAPIRAIVVLRQKAESKPTEQIQSN